MKTGESIGRLREAIALLKENSQQSDDYKHGWDATCRFLDIL